VARADCIAAVILEFPLIFVDCCEVFLVEDVSFAQVTPIWLN